jgi:hypothetical protein
MSPRRPTALLQPARVTALVAGVALLLAAVGARPWAGGWNDGSRLAAVDSLLERGTFAIDDSVFCKPAAAVERGYPPYPDHLPVLQLAGTQDKMFIDGHFHSDKPPVVSLVMAFLYRQGGGAWLPSPSQRPDVFCRVLTWLTSLSAFAVSLFCLHRLGKLIGLPGWTHALWLGSFALATFALCYTRHVNNHILQLGVVSAWCLLAVLMGRDAEAGRTRWPLLLGLGTLLGLGYNIDLGSGPLFFVFGFALVVWRTRRPAPVLVVLLAAAPWLVACHALNLAIGGVLGPINAVPAYFDWPGCPFNAKNMTGVWRNDPLQRGVYALALLFGKHGLLVHNLPLLLAIPALAARPWRGREHRPELLAGLGWCAAGWLMYTALSNNYGGACCSVRWFVPFLAPLFFLLALYLKQQPGRWLDLAVLGGWGAVLGLSMWLVGPWTLRMVPLLWPVAGCAVASWAALAWWRGRRAPAAAEVLWLRQAG